MIRLRDLDVSHKAAITGFLVTCVLGLLAAAVLSGMVGQRVALWSLLSPRSVWLKHCASPLERALKTSMREHVKNAGDLDVVCKWIGRGAPRHDYYETAGAIIGRNCLECHGTTRAVAGAIRLATYADVLPYATVRGAPLRKMALRIHAHLFGVGAILGLVGILVAATSTAQSLRVAISTSLFALLMVDILSQCLAKMHDCFAYVIWGSGVLLASLLVVSSGLIVYDMWSASASPEQ